VAAGDVDGVDGEAGAAGDGSGDDGVGDAVDAAADGSADAVVAGDADAAAGDAVAAAAGAVPLIATANAVRLARAAVSLAFVSSSNATAALAFGAVVPDVPVGFGSAVTLAAASPVAGAADSSSPKILSAAAASVLHFAADLALAEASADVLAVIF